MNYQRIYDDICKRGQERQLSKDVYTEKHHIVPKCMEGTNEKSNLTVLTAREHFLVHYILTRIYPDNVKLWYACFSMCHATKNQKRIIPNSKLYEEIRTNWSKLNRGEQHHSFGTTLSNDRKNQISKHFKNNNPNSRKCLINNIQYNSVAEASRILQISHKIIKNRLSSNDVIWIDWVYLEESRISTSTREKLSKSKSGFKHSEHSKSNMGKSGELNHFYGKSHTEDAIYKMVLNKPCRKSCVINGIEYLSSNDASRKLNISTSQIRRRLKSIKEEWKDWVFNDKNKGNYEN